MGSYFAQSSSQVDETFSLYKDRHPRICKK
ncbi:von willebrand factor, partial [Moniliophthora roreri]